MFAAFGKVFLVFKINGWDYGRLYAMKKAKKTEDRKRMDNLLNELKVLKSVREKRFLASLNYAFEDPTHLNFVFGMFNHFVFFLLLITWQAFVQLEPSLVNSPPPANPMSLPGYILKIFRRCHPLNFSADVRTMYHVMSLFFLFQIS